jgi:hypothetical protein
MGASPKILSSNVSNTHSLGKAKNDQSSSS